MDDNDDKSLIEKTIEAVKDMASSVTEAAKSAATPSEEDDCNGRAACRA